MVPIAQSDPWLAPGDFSVRHDIELLADAGIIRGPITTWPLSWPDLARDILAASNLTNDDTAIDDALTRLRRVAREAAITGPGGVELRASGSSDVPEWRAFAEAPREQVELNAATSWMTERFAARLQVTGVIDASDKQSARIDGSYVGINVGNFMISAGAMERWWGPGWDGSLVLGTNARPIPSLTIERNYTDAFKARWLRWIGLWRASISVGQAEGTSSARDGQLSVLPNVKFLAARVNFRPRPWLEFALTRSAQFCGRGRECSLTTLRNVLLGRDNGDANLSAAEEPGNQLAGYDVRLRSPWKKLPVAFYGQLIGEDEASGLPSRFLGLGGMEIWGSLRWGSWRLRAEAADTAAIFNSQNKLFDYAYRNGLIPQGYTFRGRIIGHGIDNDSRIASLSALLVRPSGDSWSLSIRNARLNFGGVVPDTNHALSSGPSNLHNFDIQYNRKFKVGALRFGVALDDFSGARNDTVTRGFVEWRQRL